jgi:hypothetical protein
MKIIPVVIVIVIAILIAIGVLMYPKFTTEKKLSSIILKNMEIKSSAFEHGQLIPAKYTCDGENINPPLQIFDAPQDAKSLALIVDDPDAPSGVWVHWLAWNIDPKTKEIAENSVPASSVEGTTSFRRAGYGGPCPPSGVHRYFFKIYALDISLDLTASESKTDLEKAMANHILAQGELIGAYSR